MTAVIVVCVGIIAVAAVAFFYWRSPRGVIATRMRRRVVLTTKHGETFVGVLVESDGHACVLREATSIGGDGAHVPVDGEVIVFRADVAYIQLP